jgi:hypothetical protein
MPFPFRNTESYVKLQVLMVASMKMIAFWDIVPCSFIEVDQRFRGAYCLHHQGNKCITLMMEAGLTSETSFYFKNT